MFSPMLSISHNIKRHQFTNIYLTSNISILLSDIFLQHSHNMHINIFKT